jgi:hypothetical protein
MRRGTDRNYGTRSRFRQAGARILSNAAPAGMDMRGKSNGNGGRDIGEEIAKARLADYNRMLDATVHAIEARGEEAGPLVLHAELDKLAEGRLKNILAVVIVDRALDIVRTRGRRPR